MLGLQYLAEQIADETKLEGAALADFRTLVGKVLEMGQKPEECTFNGTHPEARQAFEMLTAELCPS